MATTAATAATAAPESPGNRLPRLTGVDSLRAVAALLVLLLHTGHLPGPLVALKPVAAFGWSGVGLFLVISGFSIHFRWAASDVPHHDFTPRRFFQRRFFRLYPTYLAAVVVTILLLLALGSSIRPTLPWVFANGNLPTWTVAVSTAALVAANAIPVAYVGVAWSLGLEAQLYVLYAALIGRLRRVGIMRIVVAMLVVALTFRFLSEFITSSMPVGQFFPGGRATSLSRLLYAQLPARSFEWWLGVLAAEAFFGRVQLPRWTRSPVMAVALIFVAAALFRYPLGATSVNGHYYRVSDVLLDPLVGLGYFVLLQAVVSREREITSHRAARVVFGGLAAVGIFSYSLYLMHPILLTAGDRLATDARLPAVVATVTSWMFVLLGAWVFHRVIERPFISGQGDRWLMSRLPQRQPRRL
ncbi:MAG: acyltransferase family protein [Solirubrobacteraceae bacterium]